MKLAKKLLVSILALALALIIAMPAIAHASDETPVTVLVDRRPVVFENQVPIITGNQVRLPVREVYQAMGFDAQWDGASRTATLFDGETTIVITVGSPYLTLNGREVILARPAQLVNNQVMLLYGDIMQTLEEGSFAIWDFSNRLLEFHTQAALLSYAAQFVGTWRIVDPAFPDEEEDFFVVFRADGTAISGFAGDGVLEHYRWSVPHYNILVITEFGRDYHYSFTVYNGLITIMSLDYYMPYGAYFVWYSSDTGSLPGFVELTTIPYYAAQLYGTWALQDEYADEDEEYLFVFRPGGVVSMGVPGETHIDHYSWFVPEAGQLVILVFSDQVDINFTLDGDELTLQMEDLDDEMLLIRVSDSTDLLPEPLFPINHSIPSWYVSLVEMVYDVLGFEWRNFPPVAGALNDMADAGMGYKDIGLAFVADFIAFLDDSDNAAGFADMWEHILSHAWEGWEDGPVLRLVGSADWADFDWAAAPDSADILGSKVAAGVDYRSIAAIMLEDFLLIIDDDTSSVQLVDLWEYIFAGSWDVLVVLRYVG